MKKTYAAPVIKTEQVVLGVFGSYGRNDRGRGRRRGFGWITRFFEGW